ncbi:MAG: MarR family transcriptional regulator [Oceanospirillaceae bacterium]|jgi:flavin reductase (DIM6/NTAB) family NADH-FMN oxidoreductase RutF/DNA-binding MarR family transcriptional regulator|nr:MarR family transcriptional regulator [Oceanospirillaceae bacterium]MBT4441797.1 MarR family transcriptional regulator [Oceanospirillaceae bacterium]MBT6077866.1 MarR family transcriptional regulator [Oceanospirillaceae bacterium]
MTTEAFNAREFRDALSSFATGVTVVTCLDANGEPVGATASSFNSVSMDPPLILWSITKTAYSADAFINAKHFVVNVLGADQTDISNKFARSGTDKFADVEVEKGIGGVPMLPGTITCFECEAWATYDGGDHEIIVGQVKAMRSTAGSGLVFYRGAYATAEAIPTLAPVETNDVSHFIDNYLLYYLTRATHQMGDEFHQLVADDGLTTKEWRVLACLYNENSMSLAELAKRTMVDQTTLLELALGLQKHDMARVQQLDSGTKLTGTIAGQQRVVHLIADCQEAEQSALEGLDADAAETLKTMLQRIIANTD